VSDGKKPATHVWGRAVGRHGRQSCRLNPEKELDYDLFAVQGGIDLYYAEGPNGESDRAGIYGAIGTGSADSSFFGLPVGFNDLNAFTMGGYWTHYGKEGWYLDALLQGTSYNMDAGSDRPYSLSTNGFGIGASLEAGYPFPVADGWIIEPQGQVTYQHIDLDDASDGAATVSFSDVESLVGRLGARLARTWELDPGETDPRQITGWLRASFAYEFLGEPVTAFSSGEGPVPFGADYSGPSVILNAGLDADLGDNTALYANVDYEYQFDDRGESIGGEIALKVRW
jgi:outer membrane autotransporter protein